MKRRILLGFIAALVGSLPLQSLAGSDGASALQSVVTDGPVKLTARIDKPTVRVAEPIEVVVEVEAPRGARIELPAKVNRLGDFEVRRFEQTKDIPSATQADKREWIVRAVFETIKTGQLSIPPLAIHYRLDGDSSTFKTLTTAPIDIRITSVLENRADPTRFRDIKQTVDVPVPEAASRSWIAWTCGGIVAATAGLFLIAAVVKRRRRGPSPAAWALGSLEELAQADVCETGAETLFNEVVDVVREYFEIEFNIPTLPRTTREFLGEASDEVDLPDIARKRLEWLALVADEIKFARLGVGEQHLGHAFAQAKAFIAECEAHQIETTKGAV